jgi:hypothetical protein
MKRRNLLRIGLLLGTLLVSSLWLVSCTSKTPEVELVQTNQVEEPTVDVCSAGHKEDETRRLHRYMIIFDDLSVLAQATPREQLALVIMEMQKVRRDAAFEKVQPCFSALQSTQVNFMNGVINTMTSFLSGVQSSVLEQKIAETRSLRSSYDSELAALLGMRYITATPAAIIPPPMDTATFTPAPVRASGTQNSYILEGPGSQYVAIDTFLVGQEANIIAQSTDGQWVKISRVQPSEITGWISVAFIEIDGDMSQIPVE